MKVVVNRKLGEILDFIIYPYITRFRDDLRKIETFVDIDIEVKEYDDLLKDLNKKIMTHFESIEKYYSIGFNPMLDIIGENLLLECNSIEEYLYRTLEVDEATLRKNLLKAMMDNIGKKDVLDDLLKEKKHMDMGYMVSIVKDTSISSSMKWNMFCLIEDPIKYIKEYVELMRMLKPYFDELWIQGERELNKYEPGFVKNILKNDIKFLNSISDEFFDIENLKDSTVVVALSYINGPSLSVCDIDDKMILHWGYKVEEVFNKIKERKEFELERRLRIIKTLGDKTKYKMLKLIVDDPEICANDIINELELTGATVSYHTSIMSTYKLLKITKENKKNSFEIDKNTLKEFLVGIIQDFDLNYAVKND